MSTKQRISWMILLFGLLLGVAVPISRMAFFAFIPFETNSEEAKVIQVQKGQNPNDITKLLVSNGIISDGKTFIWLGRIARQWKYIKAGEYQVSPNMSPLEIFSILTSGVSVAHPITVREGENMYEVADDLVSKGLVDRGQFIHLCTDTTFMKSLGIFKETPPPTLEGYLFPETYFFNKTMSANDLIRQMVRHFSSYWGKAQDERAQQLGMTRHQVLTLASIIEKETGAPEERPIISSVFHNRLEKGMRLQSDPTTIYGMWERYEGKIHRSDLNAKNAYNTYAIQALPAGPIANPGREAIQAALFPTQSAFLYFVSHNDGTHEFSRTLEEHNRAVKKYQLDPKARAGKSWRDRLKKPASIQPVQSVPGR
jgi:UPF0755 protein